MTNCPECLKISRFMPFWYNVCTSRKEFFKMKSLKRTKKCQICQFSCVLSRSSLKICRSNSSRKVSRCYVSVFKSIVLLYLRLFSSFLLVSGENSSIFTITINCLLVQSNEMMTPDASISFE